MMERGVARVEKLQENSLDKDEDDMFKVLPEVQEEAVEDRDHQLEDLFLLRDRETEQSVAKSGLDHINESFLLQEEFCGLLKDCKDQLKTNDLGPDGVRVDLLVHRLPLAVSTNDQLDDCSEHNLSVNEGQAGFVVFVEVRHVFRGRPVESLHLN